MPIDYKKLLSNNLRSTRWGQYLEACQSVLTDIKTNKIDIIEAQYDIDRMTESDIIKLRNTLGYRFKYFDGTGEFTDTLEYLKRQITTVVPRILNRNNKPAYKYLFYIYDLNGNIYPLRYDSSINYLFPVTDWWTHNEEEENVIDKLDIGSPYILFYDDIGNSVLDPDAPEIVFDDQTLDSDTFLTLDMEAVVNQLTRHIIIPYRYRNSESSTEFMTENTLAAFYEDVNINKRKTELAYFEPIMYISGIASTTDYTSGIVSNNPTFTNVYYNYDNTISGIVEGIYLATGAAAIGLSDVSGVAFGSGSHSVIDDTITSVQTPLTETSGLVDGIMWTSDIDTINTSDTRFNARRKIRQKPKFKSFTEMALYGTLNNSGIVMYAKFPEIQYLEDELQFYSNVQVDINLL